MTRPIPILDAEIIEDDDRAPARAPAASTAQSPVQMFFQTAASLPLPPAARRRMDKAAEVLSALSCGLSLAAQGFAKVKPYLRPGHEPRIMNTFAERDLTEDAGKKDPGGHAP